MLARILKLSIQIPWVILGCSCAWTLIMLVCSILSGHGDNLFRSVSSAAFFIVMMAALVGLTYVGYCAVFRFSFALVQVTVTLAALLMFFTASHGLNHDLLISEPSILHRHYGALFPLDILLLLVTIVGAIKVYRFTLAAVTHLLFPSLHHSAARLT